MHFSILALFTLLLSLALTLASPTRTDGCHDEYCPRALERLAVAPPGHGAAPTPTLPPLTNAQRLVRGLPIKPPHRRATIGPRSVSPRASLVPRATYRGMIAVTNTANGQLLGYISKNSFRDAQYRYQPSYVDALIVSFAIEAGVGMANNVRITSENADRSEFPVAQGREGTSDFAPDSFDYAYITGTAESIPALNSIPVTSYTAATGFSRPAIPDCWKFDSSTLALVPQWEGSDGLKLNFATFTQDSRVYVIGDETAFAERFPYPFISTAFIFVPL